MRLGFWAIGALATVALCGCGQDPTTKNQNRDPDTRIQVKLDINKPAQSFGVIAQDQEDHIFKVGYGRYGISCKDLAFEEGVTPLGRFKVNAILSKQRFEMDPSLIAKSGKTEKYLRERLFNDMSAIDFKGDGETGEYGAGYISLEPLSPTKQPFEFNEYDGKFRWYSFAIHGTNDEERIGQKVTGGCLNVGGKDLDILLESIQLGDEVEITANGPCKT